MDLETEITSCVEDNSYSVNYNGNTCVVDCSGASWTGCTDGVRTRIGDCTVTGEGCSDYQYPTTRNCVSPKPWPGFAKSSLFIAILLLILYYFHVQSKKASKKRKR